MLILSYNIDRSMRQAKAHGHSKSEYSETIFFLFKYYSYFNHKVKGSLQNLGSTVDYSDKSFVCDTLMDYVVGKYHIYYYSKFLQQIRDTLGNFKYMYIKCYSVLNHSFAYIYCSI